MRPAAHVFWTRPGPPNERRFAAFETVTLAVSCQAWRAANGPVQLFTDTAGKERLERAGLLPFWDMVDTEVLMGIPWTVDADAFWDIGKAIVLAATPPGTCILDLDLIVWDRFELKFGSVAFLHPERPVLPWYPRAKGLSTPPGYQFATNIDWDAPVCNTAFLAAEDGRFRTAFAAQSMRFAIGNRTAGSGIAEMLFAGQRLLGHVARELGLRAVPLVDHMYDPEGPVNGPDDPFALAACERGIPFTHLWRHKWPLLADPAAAEAFRQWLIGRCIKVVEGASLRAELEALEGF